MQNVPTAMLGMRRVGADTGYLFGHWCLLSLREQVAGIGYGATLDDPWPPEKGQGALEKSAKPPLGRTGRNLACRPNRLLQTFPFASPLDDDKLMHTAHQFHT